MIIITFDKDRCKGCSLCIPFCPYNLIKLSEKINSSGYHPVEITDPNKCTGCASCARMCPDLAIEIVREES